jgi:hypothetical protein
MKALKTGNLALLFLLELCMLAALAFWGFHTGDSLVAKLALGIGAPLLAAIVWGILMAPRAAIRLPTLAHLALFVVIFGAATLALAVAGQPLLAIIFAALSALSKTLTYVWR